MRNSIRHAVCTGFVVLSFAASGHAVDIPLLSLDSGFVTAAGGSAKADGFSVPSAKFNYSVGYEVHYSGGIPSPLAPMDRKNYFVFDLKTLPGPITGASLKLWTGTLESGDASETFVIKETPDQPGALFDAGKLATFPIDAFDAPGVDGIAVASSLYAKLGDGAAVLASASISHAIDDSFLTIAFTPAGVAHLETVRLAGGTVVLGGLVTTVDAIGGSTPQQPFGLTGPDIPGAKSPILLISAVPEPESYVLLLAGLAIVGSLVRRR